MVFDLFLYYFAFLGSRGVGNWYGVFFGGLCCLLGFLKDKKTEEENDWKLILVLVTFLGVLHYLCITFKGGFFKSRHANFSY